MSELLHEDPWTDEVCQDWVDMANSEIREHDLVDEELVHLLARMPKAVEEYSARQLPKEIKNYIRRVEDDPQALLDAIAEERKLAQHYSDIVDN